MPKRRGRGEGSIFRRKDGTWCASLVVGRKPDGSPKRAYYYGKTRAEVVDKLTKALNDAKRGAFVEPSRMTVGEWLDTWLEQYKRPVLRPGTWDSYELMARRYLKPAVGALKLTALRPEHLQRVYNEAAEAGRAARTVRYIHQVIHGALEQALKNQLVTRNVSEATTLPPGARKEVRALTPEEMERFIEVLAGDRLGAAFVTLLGTGLRRGELLALRWEDVNLRTGTLTVRRGVVRARERDVKEGGRKTRLVFQEPKTAKGRRSIPLPEDVVSELKRWRALQNQERLMLGPAYEDHGLVFSAETGRPIEPRNFNRRFYALRRKAGLPADVNLHALRHTYATRLLERGVSLKTLQELLGHAKYSITADTYAHVSPELKREAVSRLNGLLDPQRKALSVAEEG